VSALALPTRHDEAFRYSDIEALARVWPVAAEAVHVGAGEHVARHVVLAGDAVAARDYVITIAAGGSCVFHILNAGTAFNRVSLDVTLHEGAHFELGGVMIGGGEATLEIITTITHAEPSGTSNQVVRSVVGGRATCNFLGSINVARDAQKTDAAQSVKAMLLSRTATANAVPQLEIFADDVKCAHGCAIGELDATALFYLQSRGLPPAEAQALLLEAFVADVFAGADAEAELQAAARMALGNLA
jgi:Fe-S cluster assembly protein SufD